MTGRQFCLVKNTFSLKFGNGHSQVVPLFQLTKKLQKHNCFMNLNFTSANSKYLTFSESFFIFVLHTYRQILDDKIYEEFS